MLIPTGTCVFVWTIGNFLKSGCFSPSHLKLLKVLHEDWRSQAKAVGLRHQPKVSSSFPPSRFDASTLQAENPHELRTSWNNPSAKASRALGTGSGVWPSSTPWDFAPWPSKGGKTGWWRLSPPCGGTGRAGNSNLTRGRTSSRQVY